MWPSSSESNTCGIAAVSESRTIPREVSSIFRSPVAWCSSSLVFDLCDPRRGRVYLGSEAESRPVDFVKFRIAL